jgi:hypothetical protein
LSLQNPASYLVVLHVSLACKVFLDHPQNYRFCWRGSPRSPIRVSDKQNIHETKNKNKSKKTRVRQTRLDWFWGWSKVSRCKNKNQKKTENYTKSNKRLNLDHLFPDNFSRKRDLQADKSSVVVKGPFFPRVMNPRYRIRGTNVWCKSISNKAENFDLQEVKPMHLI